MDDTIMGLGKLTAWMREVGCIAVRLPDGTEMRLGPAPVAAMTLESVDHKAAEQAEKLVEKYRENFAFRHVRGGRSEQSK
jgi:hypothetical protein